MKPFYIKKNGTVSKIGGIITALFPSYTLAEYQALEHKPLFWVRTDADYGAIPASLVSYGNNSNVSDALDDKVSKSGDTMSGTLTVNRANGTTSAEGTSDLVAGNNIPSGTEGNSRGRLSLYGKLSYRTILRAYDSTTDRTISFPNASGTVALSDSDNRFPASQTISVAGTASSEGGSALVLGNDIPAGTDGNSRGVLYLYSSNQYRASLRSAATPTSNCSFTLPNASGTLALSSEVPSVTVSYWTVGSGATRAHADMHTNSNCYLRVAKIGSVTIVSVRVSIVFNTPPQIPSWGSIDVFTLTNWTGGDISYMSVDSRLSSCADGTYGGCINITGNKIQLVSQVAVQLGSFYYAGEYCIVK